MRSIPLLLVLAFALAIPGGGRATAEPLLLAEYPHDFHWSGSPASNEAIFLIKAPNSLGLMCAVGESRTHGDGQTGTYDFFPGDPQEPWYPCVLENVTDGIDDTVGNWVYNAVEEGTGIGILESALFGTESDLVDFDIAFLRLIVESLSIRPLKSGGYEFIGQARWQFWGMPTATSAPGGVELTTWGRVRSLYR